MTATHPLPVVPRRRRPAALLAGAAIAAPARPGRRSRAADDRQDGRAGRQFGTFDAREEGLVGALSGSGPLTVFAPTDAASRLSPRRRSTASRRTGRPPARPALPRRQGQRPRLAHCDDHVREDACRLDRDPSGGQGRLPQRLDEGRQDQHRRDERHDPRDQQGAPPTGEVSDSAPGGEAAFASPPAPDTCRARANAYLLCLCLVQVRLAMGRRVPRAGRPPPRRGASSRRSGGARTCLEHAGRRRWKLLLRWSGSIRCRLGPLPQWPMSGSSCRPFDPRRRRMPALAPLNAVRRRGSRRPSRVPV